MFRLQLRDTGTYRVAAYLACVALIALSTAWGAYRVALATINLVDASIIDGSGRAVPEPEWSAPPFAMDPSFAGPSIATNAGTGRFTGLTSAATPAPLHMARASTDDPSTDPAADFHDGRAGTYRTYCVRLCDGYYWPISFSTTSDQFDRDAETCQTSCGSPARLFVHRIPGGGPGTMVSLAGLPYTSLKSAFLFRTRYDEQCKCHAQPWEEASRDRHRLFAVANAASRGDKSAAAEALRLSTKIEVRSRQTAATKQADDKQADRELKVVAAKAELNPPPRSSSLPTIDGSRQATMLRLGALPAEVSSRGFVPASGAARDWKERAFGGN